MPLTAWRMDMPLTAWRMDIPCIIQRMCEKARFPYRHPERSRGIFFVGGQTENADSEKRETPYRGRAVLLLKGLAKEEGKRGTKKISRCARNDSAGNGYPNDSVGGMDIPMTAWKMDTPMTE